ncbi:uncharacterized protein LOC134146030 isoform X2 [Rhea pennata]
MAQASGTHPRQLWGGRWCPAWRHRLRSEQGRGGAGKRCRRLAGVLSSASHQHPEPGGQRGPFPLQEQPVLPGSSNGRQQLRGSRPGELSLGLPEGRARQLPSACRVNVCSGHVTRGDTAGQCRLGKQQQWGQGCFLRDWTPRSQDEGQAEPGGSWECRAEREPREAAAPARSQGASTRGGSSARCRLGESAALHSRG